MKKLTIGYEWKCQIWGYVKLSDFNIGVPPKSLSKSQKFYNKVPLEVDEEYVQELKSSYEELKWSGEIHWYTLTETINLLGCNKSM